MFGENHNFAKDLRDQSKNSAPLHNPKQSLLTSNVKHLNQSTDHKKRMNDNLKSILVANQNNAIFDHIWDYLNTDIELWNQSIMRRYMQQHHRNDTIDT